jgi:hypothetical protein
VFQADLAATAQAGAFADEVLSAFDGVEGLHHHLTSQAARTDIMGGQRTDDRKSAMSADIPVGRVGSPQDIAAMAAFLLSEEAGFISGATYQVDGGKYMH